MSQGPAGDAVMVYLFDPQHRTLLVRARGLLDSHWMPPGGHIDDGETSAEAACRELYEELHLHCAPHDLDELASCPKDFGTGSLTLFRSRSIVTDPVTVGPELLETRWLELPACDSLPMLPATRYGLGLLAGSTGGPG